MLIKLMMMNLVYLDGAVESHQKSTIILDATVEELVDQTKQSSSGDQIAIEKELSEGKSDSTQFYEEVNL